MTFYSDIQTALGEVKDFAGHLADGMNAIGKEAHAFVDSPAVKVAERLAVFVPPAAPFVLLLDTIRPVFDDVYATDSTPEEKAVATTAAARTLLQQRGIQLSPEGKSILDNIPTFVEMLAHQPPTPGVHLDTAPAPVAPPQDATPDAVPPAADGSSTLA